MLLKLDGKDGKGFQLVSKIKPFVNINQNLKRTVLPSVLPSGHQSHHYYYLSS